MTDLPPAVPTKAVMDAFAHVCEHYHTTPDGSRMHARDHFEHVLKEEVGLAQRGPAPPVRKAT